MNAKPQGQRDQLGAYLFSIIAIVGGLTAAISGEAQYWQEHVSGKNVHIGGALIFTFGVVLLVSTIRESIKARKQLRREADSKKAKPTEKSGNHSGANASGRKK